MGVNRSVDGRSAGRAAKLALAALLVASSLAAPADAGSGSIGATSSASVSISVTIAPRVRIVGTGPVAAPRSATMLNSTAPNQLCLQSNLDEANMSVAIERPAGAAAATSARQGLDASGCVTISDVDLSPVDNSPGAADRNGRSRAGHTPGPAAIAARAPQSSPRGRSITLLIAAE
jgi:hypothetical protein